MFLLFALLLNSLLTLGFTAKLPKEEVAGLRQIAEKLRKTDWNFNVDPCTWERDIRNDTFLNYLTCDCSNSLCHVTEIALQGQNLQGSLPPELIKLPFLQRINLSLNFLRGTIPREWASLPLEYIYLFANRLSGTVPKELGSIITLKDLRLESNRFSGPLPLELGNLVNLEIIGYMAPEYAMRGYLTDKADVNSFGVVALEIVSGKCNANFMPNEEGFYLLDWAHNLQGKGTLEELIDPNLGSEFNKEEAVGMVNIALLCSSTSSTARPTMSAVVSMLEGRVAVQEVASDPSYSSENLMSNAIINNLLHSNTQTQSESESEIQSLRTGSSTSVADLYPSNLDFEYWNNKLETSSILSSK